MEDKSNNEDKNFKSEDASTPFQNPPKIIEHCELNQLDEIKRIVQDKNSEESF